MKKDAKGAFVRRTTDGSGNQLSFAYIDVEWVSPSLKASLKDQLTVSHDANDSAVVAELEAKRKLVAQAHGIKL